MSDEVIDRGFEYWTRAAFAAKLKEVLSRDPRNNRYQMPYGEARIAQALVDYGPTDRLWHSCAMNIIWPEDPPTEGPSVAEEPHDEWEPDDTTRAEKHQAEPADDWLCPACENSPCEFLQAQQELEAVVGNMDPLASQKAKRYHAYQFMTRRLHGQLGRQNRVPLPCCCQQGIVALFPAKDGVYVGYQEAKAESDSS
jgi:hypothetical protein